MYKLLPSVRESLPWRKFYLWLFILIILILGSFSFIVKTYAAASYEPPLGQPKQITWVPDDEVTFTGRAAVRAKDFLNWTLSNYQWSYADIDTTKGQNGQPQHSLQNMWVMIRNITYALLILFVIGSAALLIITAGKNTGILVFLRKFFFAVAFITLAFALTQIIYQVTDILQGFFLRNPVSVDGFIGVKDLLNISFHYNFVGLRAYGGEYKESAFIGLLFTRLTAITYNTMSAILLLRKVILWFFIAVSPIFPLLFLYYPVRNTGKIWAGEFFRWTLYGPLFCMFLSGLVWLWHAKILLLPFNLSDAGVGAKVVYPTAINILVGGPGLSLDYLNNLNYNDTYIQYLLALLMLWVVIILPFVLLRIFLDFFFSMFDRATPFTFLQPFRGSPIVPPSSPIPGKEIQRHGITVTPPVVPPPPPFKPQPTGAAKALEIPNADSVVSQRTKSIISNISRVENKQEVSRTSHVKNISNVYTPTQKSSIVSTNQSTKTSAYGIQNLQIPTMRDIARFETNRYASQSQSQSSTKSTTTTQAVTSSRQQVEHIQETLKKIANPQSATPAERPTFMHIRARLTKSSKMGDPVAASIIAAAMQTSGKPIHMTAGTGAGSGGKITGTTGGTGTGTAGETSTTPAGPQAAFPTENKVQTVNLEDYEAVRDTWYKNYMDMEPPADQSREVWLRDEISKTDRAVELITSHNPQDVKSGMEMVSQLLPFLLVGGFSQAEVIAYLKAKRKAGESALSAIEQKQKEEETQVLVESKQQEEAKHLQTEVPEEDKPNTLEHQEKNQMENLEETPKENLDEKDKIPS